MRWRKSHRASRAALPLANRHYNRQKPGAPQFVPPGSCLVFLAGGYPARALWVSSRPFAEYVKHDWPGAWMCTCFRNEGAGPASELNIEAVAATRWFWGEPPPLGMVSFIDQSKVKPTIVRGKPVWGWTWIKAGWQHVGETKGGLLAFQLTPDRMPEPMAPLGAQRSLIA